MKESAALFQGPQGRKREDLTGRCTPAMRTGPRSPSGWLLQVLMIGCKTAVLCASIDGSLEQQVTWCRTDSALPRTCSTLYLPRNVSSVVLMGLVPFLRYTYKLRTYRGDPNGSDVLFSPPSLASRRNRLSFELFLYTEMLVVFLLAGALTLVALLTIGFILIRALGLVNFLDAEPDELAAEAGGVRENQGQGDHRRHGPARRRRMAAAALRRIGSRGDN
ncbi:hypothetical protein V5799_020307 [Amblyomma americanum]|uniref:Uncharacterized protein n=1 Tax=Amblyomma americanum TaxID=6943 RepID=A0AAQ4EUR8_AMBAM